MIKKQFIAGVLAASLFGFGGGVMTAQAFDFGSVLKLGGISYLVNQFGGEINTFINKIFSQNEVSTDYATKVVPILSMGTGGYIGAVQVVGPKAQVDKVKAVGQLEFKFSKIARIKGLIPIDNINITNVNRVEGVGVSAVIDFKRKRKRPHRNDGIISVRPFSVMMGDGLTRHWQLFFLQGQETYPRQRDGRAAAIRPFAGAGNHQPGGKGVPRHYNMSGSKEHFSMVQGSP